MSKFPLSKFCTLRYINLFGFICGDEKGLELFSDASCLITGMGGVKRNQSLGLRSHTIYNKY